MRQAFMERWGFQLISIRELHMKKYYFSKLLQTLETNKTFPGKA